MIPWWLKGLVALGLFLAVAGWIQSKKHTYDESLRNEGRAEVQAKWEVDKAERIKAFSAMTSQWASAAVDAEKAQKELSAQRLERINHAKQQVRSLPATDAHVRFPASAVRLLDDAAGHPTPPAGSAAQPDGSPSAGTGDSSVELVTGWALTVIDLYEACRQQVHGWINFYDQLRTTQGKDPALEALNLK
jgi:hypothetical protein